MPIETKDEGSKSEEDVRTPPVPELSAGSADAGSALPGFDADALAKRLEGIDSKLSALDKLDDLVDARVKSIKDKRFAKLAKADEILAAVEAAGGDPEKIRGKLEYGALMDRLDNIEDRMAGAGGSASSQEAQAKPSLVDDTRNFLLQKQDELGVTLTDDELLKLKDSRRFKNESDWFGELTTQIVKKVKQGSISSGAAIGEGGPGAPPSPEDEELLAEYEKLLRHPLENAEERKQAEKELRKRNLLR